MRHREQALLLLKKAADDESLLREVIQSRQVSDEIFGFHCQQAVEKLLKALLSDFCIDFPRTHNLRLLMDLLADAGFFLPETLTDLDILTPYGTLFRYEDFPAEIELDRNGLLSMVQQLRQIVVTRLSQSDT
jgi:HEPN domain-containing protein